MTKHDVGEAERSRDPLIEEVRARRRELSERFGNDVNRLCDYLAEIEKEHAGRVVRPLRKEVPLEQAERDVVPTRVGVNRGDARSFR